MNPYEERTRIDILGVVFPVIGMKNRLVSILEKKEFIESVDSKTNLLKGKSDILIKDIKEEYYEINIERNFPFYFVSFNCDNKKPLYNKIETSLFKLYNNEALVGLKINEKKYGIAKYE